MRGRRSRPVRWPRPPLLAVLLALLLPACKCDRDEPHPRLVVTAIEADDRSRPKFAIAGLTSETVASWVKRRLVRSPRIVVAPAAGASGATGRSPASRRYRLRIEYGLGLRDDGIGEPATVVAVSARASSGELDVAPLQASVIAPVPEDREDRAFLRAKVEQVADDLVYQAELTVGPEAEVVAALERAGTSAEGPERLAAAIEIAAVRRVRSAVPALIQLLKHEDERIADRAVGALVSIGDRRAVKPLTRVTRFSDTAKMAKILDGVAALGGDEAREYLEFVSSGHDDPDIRNLAAEARERMKRRSGTSGSADRDE